MKAVFTVDSPGWHHYAEKLKSRGAWGEKQDPWHGCFCFQIWWACAYPCPSWFFSCHSIEAEYQNNFTNDEGGNRVQRLATDPRTEENSKNHWLISSTLSLSQFFGDLAFFLVFSQAQIIFPINTRNKRAKAGNLHGQAQSSKTVTFFVGWWKKIFSLVAVVVVSSFFCGENILSIKDITEYANSLYSHTPGTTFASDKSIKSSLFANPCFLYFVSDELIYSNTTHDVYGQLVLECAELSRSLQ